MFITVFPKQCLPVRLDQTKEKREDKLVDQTALLVCLHPSVPHKLTKITHTRQTKQIHRKHQIFFDIKEPQTAIAQGSVVSEVLLTAREGDPLQQGRMQCLSPPGLTQHSHRERESPPGLSHRSQRERGERALPVSPITP